MGDTSLENLLQLLHTEWILTTPLQITKSQKFQELCFSHSSFSSTSLKLSVHPSDGWNQEWDHFSLFVNLTTQVTSVLIHSDLSQLMLKNSQLCKPESLTMDVLL